MNHYVVREILRRHRFSRDSPEDLLSACNTRHLHSIICNHKRGFALLFSIFSLTPSQLDGEEALRVSQRQEVSLKTVTACGKQVRLGFN